MKTLSISVAVTTILSAILNTAYYTATHEMNVLSFTRTEPLFGLIMANHIVYAILLNIVWKRFKRSGTGQEGLTFGAIMGAVMFLPTGLVIRGAWDVPADVSFLCNSLFAIVSSAILGFAISKIVK